MKKLVTKQERNAELAAQNLLQEKRERAKNAPKKQLSDVLPDPDKIFYVYVESLGAKLPYKPLAIKNFDKFADKNKPLAETTMDILYELLHGGDPTVTKQMIERIPFNVTTEIINECINNFNFLGKSSVLGSSVPG